MNLWRLCRNGPHKAIITEKHNAFLLWLCHCKKERTPIKTRKQQTGVRTFPWFSLSSELFCSSASSLLILFCRFSTPCTLSSGSAWFCKTKPDSQDCWHGTTSLWGRYSEDRQQSFNSISWEKEDCTDLKVCDGVIESWETLKKGISLWICKNI